MHSTLVHPTLAQEALSAALQSCRRQTLALVKDLNADTLSTQAHPDFSPIGWHLGHIAYTESLWIVEHLAGLPRSFLEWDKLFAADVLPKAERQNLPVLEILLAYLETVREQTLLILSCKGCNEAEQLWHWLIQHESQHAETISMVLAMHRLQQKDVSLSAQAIVSKSSSNPEMVFVESGDFFQGCDAPEAIDNERPAHAVSTLSYWIDRTPVTCAKYQQFIEAGGYHTEKWWSPAGWQWQQQKQAIKPLYWSQNESFNNTFVCGVSWYEAEAYARFVGKRLPTESEWEKAVSANLGCEYAFGNVWEWTNSWFERYSGFQPFPYRGYSQVYFDGAHRVLKGGSWATPKWVCRPSFRNWYHPHRREMFAGFRCVHNG